MPKFSFREGIAVGIAITGIFLLIVYLFLLVGNSPDNLSNAASYEKIKNNQEYNKSGADEKITPPEPYLIKGIAVWEDTVAQWLMMVFTIIATGVLIATLRATRKMAREAKEIGDKQVEQAEAAVAETRRIGEAQVRAYLSVTGVNVRFVEDDCLFGISLVIKNSGQSPARNVFVKCTVIATQNGQLIFRDDDKKSIQLGDFESGFHGDTIPFGSMTKVIKTAATIRQNEIIISVEGEIFGDDVFREPIEGKFNFVKIIMTKEIFPWSCIQLAQSPQSIQQQ